MKSHSTLLATMLVCVLAANSGETSGQTGEPLCLSLISDAFDRPVFVTAPPGDIDRLFIVEQFDAEAIGRVRIVQGGAVLTTPFLEVGPVATNNSTGVLCLAFSPDYATDGYFYLFSTDAAGDVIISRFSVSADPNVADANSEQIVLTIPQPHHFHQGGWLGFGPDGYLYISAGDGGPANDPDQRGQDPDSLLGKLLRIDVNGDDFPADPLRNYAVPTDNPFVDDAPLDEIWAMGLREVWRASFDRSIGDLYLADVGQEEREELNIEPAGFIGGANYGWRCLEGEMTFMNDPECAGPVFTDALHEYDHNAGRCAIIGGYVYRGGALPGLTGRYLFADHCTGEVESIIYDGIAAGNLAGHLVLLDELGVTAGQITSFGEDAAGELYITTRTGQLFQIIARTDCASPCGCPWDIDGSGAVDVTDLLAVLTEWGPCGVPCAADVNRDGVVDVTDLLEILSNWS